MTPESEATTLGLPMAGQVALVTGGNRGIGRGISLALADAGAAVGIFARSPDTLEETRQEILSRGGLAETVVGTVTDVDAVRRAVEHVTATLGPIDLLVNNAALSTSTAPLAEADPTRWWDDAAVNLFGPFLFMRYTLPQMIERQRGCIVNVASNSAWLPFPNTSSYNSAKAGLVRCTETVAAEVEQHGITAFSITPGQVRTELWEDAAAVLREQGVFGDTLGSIAPTFVGPEAAAGLILTLACGKADALTGRFLGVHDDLDALIAGVTEDPDSDVLHLRIIRDDGV